ncbi:zinc finger protein Cps3 [Schizosaccharomyces japonicus yFS275]|uniref:Zinc finger protein Cps3 n=1 Tax=Schizosaccharomyces japonicus (strain yFS275 / FY16936) TaxID=402676 RepID=B6JY76_SCHJY|nr:zinc finger protein Cps3 [Schizosaccharomyces japonicus yFS275]EEB06494.1 zinc finger protein Cps3 [Schizosaccharomyces japonicus yFS275]
MTKKNVFKNAEDTKKYHLSDFNSQATPLSRTSMKSLQHVPCKFFRQGTCTSGKNCVFSHDLEPNSEKTVCKYFLKGNCKFGSKCALDHVYPDGKRVKSRAIINGTALAGTSASPPPYAGNISGPPLTAMASNNAKTDGAGERASVSSVPIPKKAVGTVSRTPSRSISYSSADPGSISGTIGLGSLPAAVDPLKTTSATEGTGTDGISREQGNDSFSHQPSVPSSPSNSLSRKDLLSKLTQGNGVGFSPIKPNPAPSSLDNMFSLSTRRMMPPMHITSAFPSLGTSPASLRTDPFASANVSRAPFSPSFSAVSRFSVSHTSNGSTPGNLASAFNASAEKQSVKDDSEDFANEEDFVPNSLQELLTPQELERRLSHFEEVSGSMTSSRFISKTSSNIISNGGFTVGSVNAAASVSFTGTPTSSRFGAIFEKNKMQDPLQSPFTNSPTLASPMTPGVLEFHKNNSLAKGGSNTAGKNSLFTIPSENYEQQADDETQFQMDEA